MQLHTSILQCVTAHTVCLVVSGDGHTQRSKSESEPLKSISLIPNEWNAWLISGRRRVMKNGIHFSLFIFHHANSLWTWEKWSTRWVVKNVLTSTQLGIGISNFSWKWMRPILLIWSTVIGKLWRVGRKSMRDRVTNSRHGNRRKPSLCWPQGDQTKRKRAGKSPKLPQEKNPFQLVPFPL